MQKDKSPYWGWYIVAAAFVALGVNYGSRYCFALFVNPLAVDLQWSRSVISLGATVGVWAYGIGGIISGRLLDRMAPRWIITIGSILLSAAFFSMSFVQTPLQFNLLFGILSGVGGSFFGVVVCNSYISKWFLKKRGVAIGFATMGIGTATMVLPFIVAPIIKGYGWRAGFVALGCLVMILGISMAQLVMARAKPEDHGLRPDGEEIAPLSALEENKEPAFSTLAQKVQFLKDTRFWILAFCFSLAVMAEMLAFTHQVAFAIDNGIERVRAGVSISIIGLASIAGRYFFGWIGDRLQDAKYAASIGFAVMALGLFSLMQYPTVYGLYGYAALFGFGYGSIATMMPYLLADRFGSGMLGTIYGVLTFFVVAAASIGPILGGYLYDKIGSYDVAWKLCLGLLILVTFVVMTLKKEGKKASSTSLPAS
jgi:MFS family permease